MIYKFYNKYFKFSKLFQFAFALVLISCNNSEQILHKGERRVNASVGIDTMVVNVPRISGYGNFYIKDSVITYVDVMTCTFFDFSLKGELIDKYFGKGKGRNELPAVMFAYPIENDPNGRCIIVDNSNVISVFNLKDKKIKRYGALDFGWNDKIKGDYASPSLYNIAGFTDLSVSFYLTPDSKILFPVSIVNRRTSSPNEIERVRYKEGAIWGELNLKTMKVESVVGQFPDIYRQEPMPHLELFDYTMIADTIYASHAVDSLIYVYKYPDKLLYTIGYECSDINREYTHTTVLDYGNTFKKDFTKVGVNSELIYCKENKTLCRTYIKSTSTGKAGLQIYRNNNLIADVDVPAFFKLLGYRDGYYYGVSYVPIEQTEGTSLIFYKLKISF